MNNSWYKFSHFYYQVLFLHVTVLFPHPHKIRYVLDERIIVEHLQPCRKCVSMWCQSVCKYKREVRLQCVLIEWKTDDSPISFETSLCTVFYYIKPNQLSQRQQAVIGSWVGIFKQSGLAARIQTRSVRLQWWGHWNPVIETCNIMIANWLNIISCGFYFVCLLPLIKILFFSLRQSRFTLCGDVW